MGKLLTVWNSLEKHVVGVLGFLAAITTLYGVIMRYVFRSAVEWVEEIVIYMIILAVYVGASSVAEERGHVGATFIVERFPIKYRRIVEVITTSLTIGFCLIVTYLAIIVFYGSMMMDERSETALRFPIYIAILFVPIGTTLISLRCVKRLLRLLFRFTPEELRHSHELTHSDE